MATIQRLRPWSLAVSFTIGSHSVLKVYKFLISCRHCQSFNSYHSLGVCWRWIFLTLGYLPFCIASWHHAINFSSSLCLHPFPWIPRLTHCYACGLRIPSFQFLYPGRCNSQRGQSKNDCSLFRLSACNWIWCTKPDSREGWLSLRQPSRGKEHGRPYFYHLKLRLKERKRNFKVAFLLPDL